MTRNHSGFHLLDMLAEIADPRKKKASGILCEQCSVHYSSDCFVIKKAILA